MDFFLEKIFKFDQKQYILCLILIGFLIFFPTFFNGFVWDDEEQIVNNQAVHSLANLPSFFIGSTFNSGGNNSMEGLYYKPLMPTTFAFIYSIFGSSAFFFHLFQVILHILNSILVFLTLQYFLEGNQEKKSFLISLLPKQESIKINSMLFPFILSLFFLLHPINTETVAYISAYQDILFFFFGIVALVLLIKFEEKSNSRLLQKLYKNETLVFFYTFLLLLLSILSKETGALFWGIILLFVVFYKKTSKFNWLAGLVFLPLVYAFLRFAIAKVYFVKHDLMPIMRISFIQRLYTLPKVIFYYLKTLVFPKDLAISQHWVILQPDFLNFYLPLIIILLFFFGLTLYLIHLIKQQDKNWKEFLFFYLWFLIGIIIHSQIIALDMTVAERWFYFPFVGLLGMLGLIIDKYQKKITKKFLILNLIILCLFSARTFVRILDWQNGLKLYSHDIQISQNAFDLENNYGVELYRNQKFTEAKVHFEKSTVLAPHWWTNWNNLGAMYEKEGNLEIAKNLYHKAIDNGNYYLAFQNYGAILIKLQKYNEAKFFLEQEALARFPQNQILIAQYLYLQKLQNQVE